MKTLFMRSDALISPCGLYRYWLLREWNASLPKALWIMLNPSTADHQQDDPTIRRCIRYSQQWGYGCLLVANLFALRSTDPKELRRAVDPVGPDNDFELKYCVDVAKAVYIAWGNHGAYLDRAAKVLRLLNDRSCKPLCLGVTKSGHPKHPLYCRGDVKPFEWGEIE